MSKRSAKPAGPVTRRQQVAAVKQIKGMEIAEAVGEKIRAAVKDEVTEQLKTITSTMLDCIDRVVECEAKQNAVLMRRVQDEGDSSDRPERTEAVEIQPIVDVAQEPCPDGADHLGPDEEESSEGG